MEWTSIDSQADLDALDRAVCWEDSSVVEYHAGSALRPYYPADTCRGGGGKDIHVLMQVCSVRAPFLELVFISCEWFGAHALEHFTLLGRVLTLKGVVLREEDGTDVLRCARLIYRWLPEASTQGDFYWAPPNVEE